MKRGIYFDFWGTLWLPTPDEATIASMAIEVSRLHICKNIYDAKLKVLRYKGAPAPGVCQILEDFHKKCPLIIISHSPLMKLEYFLKGWGLWDYFTAVISTHEMGETKEETMIRTIKMYQVDPIVYIGDTIGDATMAKRLSIDYIHIGSSREHESIFGQTDDQRACYANFLLAMPEIVRLTLFALQEADSKMPVKS